MSEFLFAGLEQKADRIAFIEGLNGRTIRYRELWRDAQAVAAHLKSLGLQRGERVGVLAPNSIDYILAWQGAVLAGGVVTGINPSYTAEEIAYQVQDAGVRFLSYVSVSKRAPVSPSTSSTPPESLGANAERVAPRERESPRGAS